MHPATTKTKTNMSHWNLPLGDFACLKDPDTKTLVIALDVSGSMQTPIEFLQSFLKKNQKILNLLGIEKLLLVIYSDYDVAPYALRVYECKGNAPSQPSSTDGLHLSFGIRLFVQKELPLGISPYKGLITLTESLSRDFRNGTPESLLTVLKETPKDVFHQNRILPTTVEALISKLEKYVADSSTHSSGPKYCTPQDVASNVTNKRATVAVPLYATLEEVIGFLKNHVKASMLGSGGSYPEAAATVAACVANACKENPGKCCVVFISDALPHVYSSEDQRAEVRTLRAHGFQDPSPRGTFEALCDLNIPVAYISSDPKVPTFDWSRFPTSISIVNKSIFQTENIFAMALIEAINFFYNGSGTGILSSSPLIQFNKCSSQIELFRGPQGADFTSDACKFYGRTPLLEIWFNTLTRDEKCFYYAFFISKKGLPVDNSVNYDKVSQTTLAEIRSKFPSLGTDMQKKHIAALVSYVTLDSYMRKSHISSLEVFENSGDAADPYVGTLVSNTTQMSAERASRVVGDFISLIDERSLGAILGLGLLQTMISQFFVAKRFSPEHTKKWSDFKNRIATTDPNFASLLSILFDAKVTKLASEDTLYVRIVEYLAKGNVLGVSNLPKETPVLKFNGNPANNSVGVLGETYLKFLNPSSVDCLKHMFTEGGWQFTTLDRMADVFDLELQLTPEEVAAVRESYYPKTEEHVQEQVQEPKFVVDLSKHTPEIKRKLLAMYRSFLPVADVGGDASSPDGLLFRLMQLSIGMAVKEKYVPTVTDTLKILAGITVYGANELTVDPSYRQMAAQIVSEMLPSSNSFRVLFDRPSEGAVSNTTKVMEGASWLTSKYAIQHFTHQLLDCIYVDQGVRDRVELLKRLQDAYPILAKCPPSISFDRTYEVESSERNVCVWGERCPSSGHVVPSAFIDKRDSHANPISCVYCTAHPPTTTHIRSDGTRTEVENPLKDTRYHDDGTPHIEGDACNQVLHQPEPVWLIPANGSSLETNCTKCGAFYPILDTRKVNGNRSLRTRCVLCRKGEGSVSNPTAFKKECATCKRCFVLACDRVPTVHEAEGEFRCGTCYHYAHLDSDQKQTVQVNYCYQTRQKELAFYLNGSPRIKQHFAEWMGLTPEMVQCLVAFYVEHNKKLFLNDERFIPVMYSDHARVCKRAERVDEIRTVDLCPVLSKSGLCLVSKPTLESEIENTLKERLVSSILDAASVHEVINTDSFDRFVGFIRDAVVNDEGRQKVECNMCTHCDGTHEWTDVFSPCGDCSFRVCGACFGPLLDLQKGRTVRATRFRCLCTKRISNDVLRQQNASDVAHQACGIASALSNPSRVGLARCVGGARGNKNTYCLGTRIEQIENGPARCCGDADVSRLARLLDGDEYECAPCAQYKAAHPDASSTVVAKLSDEEICALSDEGVPLRKCPHEGCGFPQEFWFVPGGSCGHVTCQNCEGEFCFVCGMVWTETHAVTHHDDMEDYYSLTTDSVLENEFDGSLLYGTRRPG